MAFSASGVYKSMEFRLTDGSTCNIGAEGLVITVSDGKIIAINEAKETLELASSDLSSMQFSDTETEVDKIFDFSDTNLTVYHLNGVEAGHFTSIKDASENLPAGVYVVTNEDGETLKLKLGK